jgi:hypothetical protein
MLAKQVLYHWSHSTTRKLIFLKQRKFKVGDTDFHTEKLGTSRPVTQKGKVRRTMVQVQTTQKLMTLPEKQNGLGP